MFDSSEDRCFNYQRGSLPTDSRIMGWVGSWYATHYWSKWGYFADADSISGVRRTVTIIFLSRRR